MKKIILLSTILLALVFTFQACNNDDEETPSPVISGLSPTEFTLAAGASETLTINGSNFGTDQSAVTVTLSGTNLTLQSVTDTRIQATVTASNTGGTVTVTVNGKSATSSQSVTINQAPVISDFTPKSGGVGTEVTITGSNFTADAEVTFADNKAAAVTFVSATELKATVPADAVTGKIKVSVSNVEVETATDFNVVTIPELSTKEVSEITATTASSGGNISDDGEASITARGVCWSTSEEPTIDDNKTEDGTGDGNFTSLITSLEANTTYYVRAYATNSEGTSYGNQENFTTLEESDDGWPTDETTEVVEVTNPTTGKTWMDRNLGALRAATSSTDTAAYGDLYQWGRAADGHQIRTSGTTSTKSSSDDPGHGDFILSNSDWRSPQNDNLWQGANGINNPCPSGYRLPTAAEWEEERLSWNNRNAAGAFGSPLKLPMAGGRSNGNGSLFNLGSSGGYWSSTATGANSSQYLRFVSSNATIASPYRANGFSVRCLKD